MTSFLIREATPQDAGAIDELTWMLWDHHHMLAPQRVLSADEIVATGPEPNNPLDRKQIVLVAERDGEILGFARLVVRDVPRSRAYPARSLSMLQAISVRANARRQGVGHALVASVRACAREHGVSTLQVPVLGFNTEALEFYRSLGFKDEFLLICMEP